MPSGGPTNPLMDPHSRVRMEHLAPTPKHQLQLVALGMTMGGASTIIARAPSVGVAMMNKSVALIAAAGAMRDIYPAFGPHHKLGVRYGGTGEVMPMSQAWPMMGMIYGPIARKVPVPQYGFGFTSVPNGSSRWVYEQKIAESRSGKDSGLPSTNRKARSGTSSSRRRRSLARKGGNGSRRSYRGRKRRPPYCRVHKRNHWCKYTSTRKTPYRRR